MSRVWQGARWIAVPLLTWGLAACSGSEEVTTQSITPAQKTAIAEPDCASLKTEIDRLNTDKLPDKLKQAGAKKYNPTPDEWAAFPRYNNLVETYTVKKCEPSLQQAKTPAKAKTKTADAGAALKAASKKAAAATPAKPAVAKAAAPVAAQPAAAAPAATAEAPAQQPVYQGVMMKIPQ